MASKAFYKSKQSHALPLQDILGRAQRALERGVPIGRGHPWEITRGHQTVYPDWFHHPLTRNIRDAMQAYPPIPSHPSSLAKNQKEKRTANRNNSNTFPLQGLLDRFIKRHPQVIWKVPNTLDKDWAPTLFVKRQHELMNMNPKITEEMAYQQVVLEGCGGGDWYGVQLEHNLVKRVLKKTAAFTGSETKQASSSSVLTMDGFSLMREYMRLKKEDEQQQRTTLLPSAKSKADAFLTEAEDFLHTRESKRRELDCKLLAKIRNVKLNLPSQQPSWVEKEMQLKGTRFEEYTLKQKIMNELLGERSTSHEEREEDTATATTPAAHHWAEQTIDGTVTGLAPDVTEEELRMHFVSMGVTPNRVTVARTEEGLCKGYGFAAFKDEEDLQRALTVSTFMVRGLPAKIHIRNEK